MKILKVRRGQDADLAALDEPVHERGKRFEARKNGRVLAQLRVISVGLFPICEVRNAETEIEELEGLEVKYL